MSKILGLGLSCVIGFVVATVLPFPSTTSTRADDKNAPRFLAAPAPDTVFFQGQIDIVGGEGKIVRCKDDGSFWRCAEVKHGGRSS